MLYPIFVAIFFACGLIHVKSYVRIVRVWSGSYNTNALTRGITRISPRPDFVLRSENIAGESVPVASKSTDSVTKTFCLCTVCKTAYLIDAAKLGAKGSRVECSVCGKDWFQTPERLLKTGEQTFLSPLPQAKIREVKRILADSNVPKYPRVDKIGIFVGNLPYTFTEKELELLFAEYGLTNVVVVRDKEQQSKGFAFIEV